MDKNKDELMKNLKQLDLDNLREVRDFAIVVDNSREAHIEPPTAEQWNRVPSLVKWHIAILLFTCTWENWLAEIGLKLGMKIGTDGRQT